MTPPRTLGAVRLDVLLFVKPELLRALPVHPSSLSRWRRGLVIPDPESRRTIHTATGIPADDWDTQNNDDLCPLCGAFNGELNAHGC